MSYVSFKYCPLCGEEMPQNNMMKFCPFCGGRIPLEDNQKQEIYCKESISAKKDIPRKKVETLIKGKIEIDITDKYYNSFLKQIGRYECSSIMLKSASDTQKLVHELEKVLLRGSFAIRLAVDNMPSIILYKNKSEDVVNLSKIFIDNQASISVIPGDFNDKMTVEQLFPIFSDLDMQMQQIIKSVPINLWIGDKILGVFAITYRDTYTGILAISDKNIYVVYNSNTEKQWLVISYSLLLRIVAVDNCLQFIYKDKKVESVVFRDKQEIVKCSYYFQQIFLE